APYTSRCGPIRWRTERAHTRFIGAAPCVAPNAPWYPSWCVARPHDPGIVPAACQRGDRIGCCLLRLLTAAHGTHATCRDEGLRSAFRGDSDIDQTSPMTESGPKPVVGSSALKYAGRAAQYRGRLVDRARAAVDHASNQLPGMRSFFRSSGAPACIRSDWCRK